MKRLQKTDFINRLLAGTVGQDVDTTNHAVYEVVATSSIPLRGKTGTLFENGVIEPSTLFQLAAAVNRDPLPLMQDHDMNGHPKGKYFYSEVVPNNEGYQELRGFMYTDPTELEAIAKIDNGTVDEVSIAFAAQQMLCSNCGWDYAAALEADNIMPLFERKCANGHQIGKDGTHLRLVGVKDALELSLVSRGAAKNSKIIGQSDSKLGKQVERLAAHGLSLSDIYVTATASKGYDNMDTNELIVQLSDAKAKATVAERSVEKLEAELAEARGARAEADKRANDAEASLREARDNAAAAPTAEATEQAAKDSKDAKASVDFLTKQFTAVMAASGKSDVTAPDTVDGLIEAIEANTAELSAILPTGGVTVGANATDEQTPRQDNFSQFRPVRSR